MKPERLLIAALTVVIILFALGVPQFMKAWWAEVRLRNLTQDVRAQSRAGIS